jgi:hypothetical protein
MVRGLTGLLALSLLCGCAPANGLRVEGPARPSVSIRVVLVLDYRSQPGTQPDVLWLDPVTAMVGLRWSEWGGPRAVAEGVVVTAECGDPSCLRPQQPGGLPGRLILDRSVQRGETSYYSRAMITPAEAADFPEDLRDIRLPVPAA